MGPWGGALMMASSHSSTPTLSCYPHQGLSLAEHHLLRAAAASVRTPGTKAESLSKFLCFYIYKTRGADNVPGPPARVNPVGHMTPLLS